MLPLLAGFCTIKDRFKGRNKGVNLLLLSLNQTQITMLMFSSFKCVVLSVYSAVVQTELRDFKCDKNRLRQRGSFERKQPIHPVVTNVPCIRIASSMSAEINVLIYYHLKH